ncbi:hypothetical protein HFP15_35695 [Amycolatopsis sp. K13G38]|uniref:Transposase IS701-like DDE domain-containing protein n=1 Tax=Amycolatopsis acididurans TaxID=2724524 RepID=A0ABX1JG85_9PSEU|nr:hypothetical protein [Amycolatopsis acididurans]
MPVLTRAVWDADAVRDDVRDAAVEHLGDHEAMLVVDGTGDIKNGACTAGVQRQYTGTAGRIENSQVGVFLTYTTKLGVPAETAFATKPELTALMIVRALDAGVPAQWVAGDEVDGANRKLRRELEARQAGHVLAVACDHRVTTATGTHRADELIGRLPKRAWQRLSAGKGAKGHG